MAEKTAQKYIEGIGRRKGAIARVRITANKKNDFVVNDKDLSDYFQIDRLVEVARSALKVTDKEGAFSVSVKVSGGGKKAQAEAIRLGAARALIEHTPELREKLKPEGYLTRDARVKERKKFGLRKARRAPQWSKR